MCLDIQLKILIVSNIQYQRLVPTVPSMTFNNSKFVLFTTPWQIDVIYNLYLAMQVHVFSKRSKIQIPGPLSPDEKWTFSYLCFSFDFHGPICNECWFSSLRSLWSLIYRSPDLIKIRIANSNLWYPARVIPEFRPERWHRCWWRMLETKCVDDKFKMLVTDLIHWKNCQNNDSVTNILNRSPS